MTQKRVPAYGRGLDEYSIDCTRRPGIVIWPVLGRIDPFSSLSFSPLFPFPLESSVLSCPRACAKPTILCYIIPLNFNISSVRKVLLMSPFIYKEIGF